MTIGDIEIQALRKEIGRYKKAFEDIRADIDRYLTLQGFGTAYRQDVLSLIDKHNPNKGRKAEMMTNQEKFIEVFGIDAWRQIIVFSMVVDEFKAFWTSPYVESEGK